MTRNSRSTRAAGDEDRPEEAVAALLRRELRAAGHAAVAAGATAQEVTAAVTGRLHRLRRDDRSGPVGQ